MRPRCAHGAPRARRVRTNGVDTGRRLLLVSPYGWRWWSSEPSTTRRSAVDRRTATMMYASRNRKRAIRRWLPLNRGVRDALPIEDAGRNAGEDQICCGGAPVRRGGLAQTRRRSRAERRELTVSVLGHHLGPEEPGEIPARSRRPRPSARSCAQRVDGSGETDGSVRPTSGPRSRVHAHSVIRSPWDLETRSVKHLRQF